MKTIPKKPNMPNSPHRKNKGTASFTFNFGDFEVINDKKLNIQNTIIKNDNSNKYLSPNMKNYDTFSPFRSDDNQSPPGFGTQDIQQPQAHSQNNNLEIEDHENLKQVEVMLLFLFNDFDIKQNREDRLKEIKRKMNEILKTSKERWTPTDAEFMKIATEPKMFSLLKNLKL